MNPGVTAQGLPRRNELGPRCGGAPALFNPGSPAVHPAAKTRVPGGGKLAGMTDLSRRTAIKGSVLAAALASVPAAANAAAPAIRQSPGGVALVRNRLRRVAITVLAAGVFTSAALNVGSYLDWIQSDNAALVRAPSVEYGDYPRWQMAVRCRFHGGTAGVTTSGEIQCAHLPE